MNRSACSPGKGLAAILKIIFSLTLFAMVGGKLVAAPLSGEKDLTSFSFPAIPGAVGVINPTDFTIIVVVPYSQNVTALVASFTSSPLSVVRIGATVQTSGVTANDFTGTVTYRVQAENGSFRNYYVTVEHAPVSSAKTITSFGFLALNPAVNGFIDQALHTITLTVPYSVPRSSLSATFTISPLAKLMKGVTEQANPTPATDFTGTVVYSVVAEDLSTQNYSVTVNQAPASNLCYLTAFAFAGFDPAVTGTIDQNAGTINLKVPYGTSLAALVAEFTCSAYSTVTVAGTGQVSGVTANNFSSDKVYRVTAENGIAYRDYTVHVSVEFAARGNSITGFEFRDLNPVVAGVINQDLKTISLVVPYGTSLTSRIATFTSSPFSTVWIGATQQFSGVSSANFSGPVAYRCISQDVSEEIYTVTMTTGPPATGNQILTFGFETGFDPPISGFINEATKAISVTVPYSADLTALKASFTSSPFSSVVVNGVPQISGVSANDFSAPVAYHCFSQDLSEEIYTVTVVKAAVRTGNDLLSFGFSGLAAPAVSYINQTSLEVTVTVPFSTVLSNLAAAFTASPYATVSVSGLAQVSGSTTHDFTLPVIYKVTSESGVSKEYTVIVSRAEPAAGNDMTSFSFDGLVPPVTGVIDPATSTITLTVPNGTGVSGLIATFTSSLLSTVKIGSYIQASGITANNFTTPVIYTVRSEAGGTHDYTVRVISPALSSEKLITGFRFDSLEPDVVGVIDQNNGRIDLLVPFGTNVTALAPTFTNSPLSAVQVGPYIQTSGISLQDFTHDVVYDVFAEDGTISHYTVHVAVNEMTKRFLSFYLGGSFTLSGDPVTFTAGGIINDSARTILVAVPFPASKNSLTASFTATSGITAYIGAVAQVSGSSVNDFTLSKVYRLEASDGSVASYTVTVINNPPDTQKRIISFSFNGLNPKVGCVVNEASKTITAQLPNGTSLLNLVASFETAPSTARVKIGAVRQVSGVTPNNFTNQQIYRCIAEDGSFADYTVNAIVLAPSTARQITDFRFNGLSAPAIGTIDEGTGTIRVVIPWAADIAHLTASFTNSPLSMVRIGAIPQTSGVTVNSFAAPVYYSVTSESGAVSNYLVIVTRTPASTGCSIIGFRFEAQFDPAIQGVIDESSRTISLLVPYSQNLSQLIASFTTSPYASVLINSSPQVSGVTVNNFSAPLIYTCRSESGNTTNYTVSVSRKPAETGAFLLSFRFNEPTPVAIGVIDQENFTVTVHLPQSQQAAGLTAVFSLSPMARAYVGGVLQTSGLTANNFNNPVVYQVRAEDASFRYYHVNIVRDPVRTGKEIESFSFQGLVPPVDGIIDPFSSQIMVHVPFSTNLNGLVATFSRSYLSSVTIAGTLQVSGVTANNFSGPLNYLVTAEDGSSRNYQVTVVRDPVSHAKQMTDFRFNGLVSDAIGTIDEASGMVYVTIPWSADINNLAATYTVSPQSVVRVGLQLQSNGFTRHSFTSPVVYTVTSEDGTTRDYTVIVNRAPAATGNEILSFDFRTQFEPDITGTINQALRTITLMVPWSTDVRGLIPTFTSSTSSSVYFESTLQVSGITANNFTNPQIYKCLSEDGSSALYSVTVVRAPAASSKEFIDFRIPITDGIAAGAVDQAAKTVKIHVPFGTDISYLVPKFTLSDLASAYIDGIRQVSGETPVSFTRVVVYRIVAEDNTESLYTVSVIIDANTEKRIYTFGFNSLVPPVSGIINESAKTINLYVPYSVNRGSLVATFTKSVNSTAWIGTTEQVSGVTANSFAGSKAYTVKAQDNSTVVYTVSVANDPPSNDARLTEFRFANIDGVTTDINEGNGTIRVTVPFATPLTALVAVFSPSPYSTVKIGTALQTSGVTANNFNNPLIYTVYAESGLTREYQVTVIKAPPATGNSIITFNLANQFDPDIEGVIDPVGRTVSLTVPFGQAVTSLVATFTVSPFASLSAGGVTQVSGTTANDFTQPIDYQCIAQDGSTELYRVTVYHAPASNLKDILSFGFDGLLRPAEGVINQVSRMITVQVPGETDLSKLKARFVLSPHAVATVGGALQVSGSTINDFTNPVEFQVIAEDNSVRTYMVRVFVGQRVDKRILTFGITGLPVAANGQINEEAGTIAVYVPFSTDRSALRAAFTASSGSTVWIGTVPQVSGITLNDFNSIRTYTVKAEDGGTKDYQVSILKSPALTGNQITAFLFGGLTPPVDAIVDQAGKTIRAMVPFGTPVNALVATFSHSAFSAVTVNGVAQVSGISANDFSVPVIYRCTSESGLVNEYIATITVAAGSSEKEITYFAFEALTPPVIGVINQTARTISLTVPYGTTVSSIRTWFTCPVRATVQIPGKGMLTSGTSMVDYSVPVICRVTAEDGSFADYTVTVTIVPDTSAPLVTNAIQSIANTSGHFAVIQSSEGTGKVYMVRGDAPQLTVADLEQSVTTGRGRSAPVVQANADIPVSVYALDQGVYFTYATDASGNKSAKGTNPITIIDAIAPNVYMQEQTVSNGPTRSVNIRSSDPVGTVYLILEGIPRSTKQQLDAAVGTNMGQKSPVTLANRDIPVSTKLLVPGRYHAFAVDENGNLSAESTTVATVTQASHIGNILSFSFNSLVPPATGALIGDAIFVQVKPGTPLTGLVAFFSLTQQAKAYVGLVEQVSGVTPNNFSKSVVYTVEAEDGTVHEYTVTVSFTSSIGDEVWFSGIRTFPNPFSDRMVIDMPAPAARIQVYSVHGELMRDLVKPTGSRVIIETAEWAPGIYLVRLYGTGGLAGVHKVIRE